MRGVAEGRGVSEEGGVSVAERAMEWMVPARWEGAGAGLSWITMTKQKKENTHTHTQTHTHTRTYVTVQFGSARTITYVQTHTRTHRTANRENPNNLYDSFVQTK